MLQSPHPPRSPLLNSLQYASVCPSAMHINTHSVNWQQEPVGSVTALESNPNLCWWKYLYKCFVGLNV